MRTRNILPALAFGLAAFFAYAVTAAPDILYGDPGEFQFTLPLAGVGHPTGYPLFHLLGWVWERFFGGNPAWGANLFSAWWGGVAVGAFYLTSAEALVRLRTRLKWSDGERWLAGLATLVFAMNPSLWAQGTQVEVYTLQAALAAAILGATLAAGRRADAWPLWPLALFIGLGLAHHLTTVFLLPGVLLFLLLTRPDQLAPRAVLKALPWALAPLALYLYIPWRAPASPWLYPQLTSDLTLSLFENTVAGNLRFILGIGFSSALGAAPLSQQLATAWRLYALHFTWAGLTLAGMGLLAQILEGDWPMLVLTGLSFLLLQAFNLVYGIGDIATYYLPLYLIVTLWLALGLAYGVEWLTRMTSPRLRRWWLVLPAFILILPATQVRAYQSDFDRREDRAARIQWESILAQPLAPDALLVSNDRDEMTPLIYLQQIEGRAPGMLGLFPLLAPTPDWADLNMTLKSALATGRPVYLIKPMPGVEALYVLESVGGGVSQVTGPQPPPEESFEAPYTPELRWLGVEWQGEPRAGERLQLTIYWRTVQQPQVVWHSFLHLVDAGGEKVAQAADHRPGGDYLPSTLWRPGDVIADRFELDLPATLEAGEYTLLAGFYDPQTGQRLADPLPVARLKLSGPSQ